MEYILLTITGIILLMMILILLKIQENKSINKNNNLSELEANIQTLQAQRADDAKEITRLKDLEKQAITLQERTTQLSEINSELGTKLKDSQIELREKTEELHKTESQLKVLNEKLENQKKDIENLQNKFQIEFENVAHKILEQNSAKFTEKNEKNIGDLLAPLKEKIQNFEKKVEETYEKGLKDQTDLRAELKKLHDLNNKISDEANNLTKALKADVKKQGNWGEMILEKVLERSGLKEGVEFSKQLNSQDNDGKRLQPDVVINLPGEKHIIIDSKVSLVAYERWVNESNDNDREQHKKEHLSSLKAHVKSLSEKKYENLLGINSPDFVLLFLPIESSFSMAVEADKELFNYAWDRQVVLVSPSTLLATLRTIASIWKQENQTKFAFEISRKAGAMYDKFVGFINDMQSVGKNIEKTQKDYDAAMNKLKYGKGNLIKASEDIKELGIKATKTIPQTLLD